MKYSTIFSLISQEFRREKIPFVLVGGFAVNYYKVTRQTADVDFLLTRNDYPKALSVLQEAGYRQIHIQEIFARLKSSKQNLMDVDFIFVDEETLRKIIKEGKTIKIAGERFTVPSLDHLIALKLHSIKNNPSREFRDLPDIMGLIKINKVRVKEAKFRDLCLKYGSKELYHKIVSFSE